MILTLLEVAALKKEAAERFSQEIHFHDGCGGQYFTVEKPTEAFKEFIVTFFAERKCRVLFSENGEYFSVEESSSC